MQWFQETPLISLLVSKLGPENEWCEQANVEQLLCDVLDSGGGPVGGVLCSLGGANGVSTNGGPSNGDNGSTSDSHALLPLIMK